jgi:hypothetical protein
MHTADIERQAGELDSLAKWLDSELAAGQPPAYLAQVAATTARIAAARMRAAAAPVVAPAPPARPAFVSALREPSRPLARRWTPGELLLAVLSGALVLIVIYAVGSLTSGPGAKVTPELVPVTAACHGSAWHR